jgi:hypothetical protein
MNRRGGASSNLEAPAADAVGELWSMGNFILPLRPPGVNRAGLGTYLWMMQKTLIYRRWGLLYH